jgi:hypothetical protein
MKTAMATFRQQDGRQRGLYLAQDKRCCRQHHLLRVKHERCNLPVVEKALGRFTPEFNIESVMDETARNGDIHRLNAICGSAL